MNMRWKFVGFLGIGNYLRRTYSWDDKTIETEYAPVAILKLLEEKWATPPDRLTIVATKKAWDTHGSPMCEQLKNMKVDFAEIPSGARRDEQQKIFDVLIKEFRVDKGTTLVVDITLGYRAQPFYAASVLAFIRATEDEEKKVQVLYAGDLERHPTPVWDVTSFIEVLDWANALQLFLKTGRVGPSAALAQATGGRLATKKDDRKYELSIMAKALRAFGDDLATLRTGDLLLGRDGPSSASRLSESLRRAREDVVKHLPQLAEVLTRLDEMVSPLVVNSLTSKEGQAALAHLAGLYLEMERYVEAATTVREAWITRYASEAAARPGESFSTQERARAEKRCRQALGNQYDNIFGQVRNDLNHAQMNRDPMAATKIINKVKEAVDSYRKEVKKRSSPRTDALTTTEDPVFLNISNHPSSTWGKEQTEAALALLGGKGRIVDIQFPDMDPERVDFDYAKQLANGVLKQVQEVEGRPTHAMVQGEHVLTTVLVRRLQEMNVCCVSATTRRQVEERPDGTKVSRFEFRSFRSYPDLC